MTELTFFVGLDVHKKTISVAVVEAGAGAVVRFYGTIANTPHYERLGGLECRHPENAALSVIGADEGCEDHRRIDRSGDAIQADIVQRIAIDGDPPDRDDSAVLLHTNDRVVASIRNI